MDSLVRVQNLSFCYEKKTYIFTDLNTHFKKNLITGIFGSNGSGKTTLLRCIANIYKNYKGFISVDEKNLSKLNPLQTAKILAYVPQEHFVSFAYSVYEMVLMGRNPTLNTFSTVNEKDISICEKAMKKTGIFDIAFKPYVNLSGGQRQLVLIARAISQETPIIILDEPTSSLDFKNQLNIWHLLQELKTEGKTVIVCTHDPNHITWFCDEVVVMKTGKILCQGNVHDVMNINVLNELYGNVCTVRNEGIFPNFKNKNL